MELTRKVGETLLRCCWVLLILALPGAATAAEFSATLTVKDGARTISGKIYVSDGKRRQEFIDAEGHTITIVRPDQKVAWVILPRQRSYLEIPLTKKLPGQFILIPPQAGQKRLVGKERLNGFDTEKYEVNVPVGTSLERQTFWVAPQLGLPIKMECVPRQFSLEYKGIKEEKVPERLFNLPPGLQKLDSISGFADRVEE
jgi:hypothetical protein